MINELLSRLDKCKPRGQGHWGACCPAHDDKSPSLAIKCKDDGRILLHCFSGCSVSDIVEAVGMKLEDLFPKDLTKSYKKERVPFPAQDILNAIAYEATIISLAASDMLSGKTLSKEDYARLETARNRILEAITYAK